MQARHSLRFALWTVAVTLCCWTSSYAVTASFTGASTTGGGNGYQRTQWLDTDNWAGAILPGTGDVASLEASGTWSGVSIGGNTTVDSLVYVLPNEFDVNAMNSSYTLTLGSGNLTKQTNGNQGISTDVILGANGTWTHLGTINFAGAFGIKRPVTGNASLTFSSSGVYSSQYPAFAVNNSGSITLTGTTGGQPNGITLTPRIDLRTYASTTIDRIADGMPLSINSAAFTLYGQNGQVSSETVGATTASGLTSLVLRRNGATSATLNLTSLTRANQAIALIRPDAALGSDVMLNVSAAPANPNGMVAPWILRQASSSTENNNSDTNFVDYNGATGFFTATYTSRTEADFSSAGATEIVALTKTATNPSLSADLSIHALKMSGGNNPDIQTSGSPTLSIGSGGLICAATGNENIYPKVDFGSADGVVYVTGPGHLSLNLQGAVSGTGGLTKLGGGSLGLASSANTFTGPVTVHDGQLVIYGTGSGDGVGLNRAGTVLPLRVSFHGLCTLYGHDQRAGGLDGEGTVRNLAGSAMTLTIDRDNSTTSTFSGIIVDGSTGSLGVVKKGNGTQIFSGANTYTGLTDVQAGALAYGADDVIVDTAGIKVSGGTLDIGAFSDTVASVQLTAGSITGSGVLTSTSNHDVQSGTISAVLAGGVSLNKTTGGTAILAGANAYSGGTTVSDGTLLVSNASGSGTGSGAVTVANGAVLGGTGTISASLAPPAVTVNAGGTLAPGASPGILTVTNTGVGDAVAFAGGSTFEVELNGAAAGSGYDVLAVNGTISLGGADLSILLGYTPATFDSFFIVQNDGTDPVSGTFAGFPDGFVFPLGSKTATISYFGNVDTGLLTGGNDVAIQVIPEPAAVVLLAMGALAFLRRRR